MNYVTFKEGLDLIQDGDMVFVCKAKTTPSIIAEAITIWEHDPAYHVGLAFWANFSDKKKRLMMVEAVPNATRIINLNQYHLQNLRVLAKPDIVKNSNFTHELLDGLGSEQYSLTKSILSGIRQYVKIPLVDMNGAFCSELTMKMWVKGGLKLLNRLHIQLDPAELEKVLVQQYKVQFRCWIKAHDHRNK